MIVDFALPPRCSGCGAITSADDRFCHRCWQSMVFLSEPCCARCGVPFDREEGEGACCAACLDRRPAWDSARAALAYGDVARTVAMRLKYGRRTGVARLMAAYMAVRVSPELRALDPLIVPVPLHRWRLWNRGFNQSLAIARHLSRSLGCEVDPFVLKRVRRTLPLRDMPAKERARQVRGAFALDDARVSGIARRHILLVDDVHTSGATAAACTKALRKGGAASIYLLCWARVLKQASDD